MYFATLSPNILAKILQSLTKMSIHTSFFELFKIGPGPSSSHTVGPMRAANDFRALCLEYFDGNKSDQDYYKIRVELYGALAATGHGHGTHRAVLAGLYGQIPQTINTDWLSGLLEVPNQLYEIDFGELKIPFSEHDIYFDYTQNPYRHPNTLKFVLLKNYYPCKEEIYYSVGGGFIEKEGINEEEKKRQSLPYTYHNMDSLLWVMEQNNCTVEEVLFQNEMALTGLSKQEVLDRIGQIMDVMRKSVERGIKKEGILPGGLNVHRRAKGMFEKALYHEKHQHWAEALFARLNAYALATSEENAAGQMVVTAPTNGAAGILPACLEYLRHDCQIPEIVLQQGLLIAAMIGFIIKENASISGAELGCMAEVGSASSMAAALFSYCNGGDIHQIGTAAEIALEHHLGMTCDPIKGLVQIPCIERNANGAIKAYNAYLLAAGRTGIGKPVISFDQVVEVMRQTGQDLSHKYKETATGGLATSFGWGNMPGS